MIRVDKNCMDLAIIELTNDVVEQLLPTNRFISIAEMDLRGGGLSSLLPRFGLSKRGHDTGRGGAGRQDAGVVVRHRATSWRTAPQNRIRSEYSWNCNAESIPEATTPAAVVPSKQGTASGKNCPFSFK